MASFFRKNSEFKEIHVKGEVSESTISKAGNLFFDLKDKKSVIPCVVYKRNRKDIGFEIADGMKLLVIANVNVYVPHGKYQLDVQYITEDGLGKLYIQYRQLKEKLMKEGLFETKFKKNLPTFPKRIGVITSKEGSAIHDILKTINEQWPYCQVFIFPSQVQGASATTQLITRIKKADSSNMDVLIIARGGGSDKDLWSFNDEQLVRTVFDCETPVISAIGHEDDVTLCDLVSDKRASTPTMAANFAVNNKEKIIEQVNHYNVRLLTYMSSRIDDYKKEFNYLLSKTLFKDSNYVYKNKQSDFNNVCTRFEYTSSELINSKKNMLSTVKSEYVIRHPCKIQYDSLRQKLNDLEIRLIDAIELIIKRNQQNMDKATEEFKFQSYKYISNKKAKLNQIKTSYAIKNPCKVQINDLNLHLKQSQNNITKSLNYIIESNQKDFENILTRNVFKNPSLIYTDKSQDLSKAKTIIINQYKELILTNSHELNSIKNKSVLKNPHQIYEVKIEKLERIKEKNIIKNPYLLLEEYSHKLELNKEKLDKIKQVILLKQKQKKQKSKYISIIISIIVILVIIIILLLNGGI